MNRIGNGHDEILVVELPKLTFVGDLSDSLDALWADDDNLAYGVFTDYGSRFIRINVRAKEPISFERAVEIAKVLQTDLLGQEYSGTGESLTARQLGKWRVSVWLNEVSFEAAFLKTEYLDITFYVSFTIINVESNMFSIRKECHEHCTKEVEVLDTRQMDLPLEGQ